MKINILALVCVFLISCNQKSNSQQGKDSTGKISITQHADSVKARLYYDSAKDFRKKGDYELSTKYFQKALENHYHDAYAARLMIGSNYFDLKNYAMAMVYDNSAVQENPKKNFGCYHNRALAEYYVGISKEAILEDIDSAVLYGDTSNIRDLYKEAITRDSIKMKCKYRK